MWQKVLRAIGCLSYLGLLGIVFGLVSYVAFSQFVRRGVTPTPDLGGLVEDEARALLVDQGLRPKIPEDEDRFDDEVPAGHVLLQEPSAGTLVKRGSDVTLILSRGPRQIEVPDVVGSAVQAARVTIAAAGLRIGGTFSMISRSGRDGEVIAQRPSPGSRVELGAPVDLFLSLESAGETYVMPDLVKRPAADVRRFFTRLGFEIGRVSYQAYAGVEPGTVLRQFPPAGHPLRRGEVISLTLAAAEPGAAAEEAPSEENQDLSAPSAGSASEPGTDEGASRGTEDTP